VGFGKLAVGEIEFFLKIQAAGLRVEIHSRAFAHNFSILHYGTIGIGGHRLTTLIRLAILAYLAASIAGAAGPRDCREKRTGSLGWPVWSFDGRDSWSASTDARNTGQALLRCRLDLPSAVTQAVLHIDHLLVSFVSRGSRQAGGGLSIRAESQEIPFLSATGEDWIEAGPRSWRLIFDRPVSRVTVELRLIDNSPADPLRIDVRGLRVTAPR
jgi:hypothetical protein